MQTQSAPKPCEQCGESPVKQKDRKFCSKRCAGLARQQRLPDDKYIGKYRRVKTSDGRNMLEHRFVMEQIIGRRLRDDEQVHHINHNGLDNRPENLELVSTAEHGRRHRVYSDTKPCAVCGVVFEPPENERGRIKTCGPKCASTYRGRQISAAKQRRKRAV